MSLPGSPSVSAAADVPGADAAGGPADGPVLSGLVRGLVREALRAALADSRLAKHGRRVIEGDGQLLRQLTAAVVEALDLSVLVLTSSQLLTVHSALDQAAVYTRLIIARSKVDLPGHEELLAEQDALVDLFEAEIVEAEMPETSAPGDGGVR